jgi:hypothetical protein
MNFKLSTEEELLWKIFINMDKTTGTEKKEPY